MVVDRHQQPEHTYLCGEESRFAKSVLLNKWIILSAKVGMNVLLGLSMDSVFTAEWDVVAV